MKAVAHSDKVYGSLHLSKVQSNASNMFIIPNEDALQGVSVFRLKLIEVFENLTLISTNPNKEKSKSCKEQFKTSKDARDDARNLQRASE